MAVIEQYEHKPDKQAAFAQNTPALQAATEFFLRSPVFFLLPFPPLRSSGPRPPYIN